MDPVYLSNRKPNSEPFEIDCGRIRGFQFRGNLPILDILCRDWNSHAVGGKPSFNEADEDGGYPMIDAEILD